MTTIRILHISDLHFGVIREKDKDPRPAHWFTPSGGLFADPSQLAKILKRDASEPPDLIVASGDIGWSGKDEDYQPALEFFHHLRKAFPSARIIVAPGNHDVDREQAELGKSQDAFIEFLTKLHGEEEYRRLYRIKDAALTSRDDLIAVDVLGAPEEYSCVAVTFNSAAGLHKDPTPVRVDPKSLERVDDHLQDLNVPEGALKICVLHHHLFPFAEAAWKSTGDTTVAWENKADPDLLANSAKFQGWLAQRRFHLVLHGHKHTSHGREDILWRRNDRLGRRLLVVGAGSAGVEDGHRAKMEPLSFNVITATRLSRHRWQVDINVREILLDLALPEVRSFYHYRSVVGVQYAEDTSPPTYRAERVDDCHRAIDLGTRDQGLQHSFLSVVESSVYIHPKTARFKGQPATHEQIVNCFQMLHPEYDVETTWDDYDRYDQRLQDSQLHGRFQFEHGSRLFRSPDRGVRRNQEDVWRTSPLLRVVDELKRDPMSHRAYVGLYRPDIDVLGSRAQPLPGLMSLQFISRAEHLDVTVTFRKIELSFWWCVNMLEVSRLLEWVCSQVTKRPGRITFFAALAEWKQDPEAPVPARLDSMSLSDLMAHALLGDWRFLIGLITEKERLTNDNNLDGSGLERFVEILTAMTSNPNAGAKKGMIGDLRDLAKAALKQVEKAQHAPQYNEHRNVLKAVAKLKEMNTILQELAKE